MARPLSLTREYNLLARLESQRAHNNSPQMAKSLEKAINQSKNIICIQSTAMATIPAHTFNEYAQNLHNELKKL